MLPSIQYSKIMMHHECYLNRLYRLHSSIFHRRGFYTFNAMMEVAELFHGQYSMTVFRLNGNSVLIKRKCLVSCASCFCYIDNEQDTVGL